MPCLSFAVQTAVVPADNLLGPAYNGVTTCTMILLSMLGETMADNKKTHNSRRHITHKVKAKVKH